jgi:6-phosphogluconolactonase
MLKKTAALFLVCASIAPWIGCGSTSNNYLYAALPTVSEFAAFREDPNSGVLTPLAFSPITAGPGVQAVVMHPSNKFLYAANSAEIPLGDVSLYTISSSGVLTEDPQRTVAGTTPSLLAIDSAGAYLYVANTGSKDISVFSIDPKSGTLKAIFQQGGSATAFLGISPLNMALAPSGNVLYVTGPGVPQGFIEIFTINAGVLTFLASVQNGVGAGPYGLAIAPGGASLYTTDTNNGTISEFSIQPDGTLTFITSLAVGYASPLALLIDKTGKFMFVADSGSSKVSGYAVDPTNGGLQVLGNSPFVTTKNPTVLGMDPSGHHLFVGTQGPGWQVESFTLGGDGSLTEVGVLGIPSVPTSMVITP